MLSLPLPPILPWFEAHIAAGIENEPWRHGHFGQISEEKLSFATTMFWYTLNCLDPWLSQVQNLKYPWELVLSALC